MKILKLMAVGVLLAQTTPHARAIATGQVDTFESGATEGWTSGISNPQPPANVDTGGPAGADDHYMRLTANGDFGPGGKLVAFNQAQWAGDYTAAGVATITMDVNNLGANPVTLRLTIGDAPTLSPLNFAATAAVTVPAGSGWTAVSFAVDAESLTAVRGSVATALATAKEVRLSHSPNASRPDNIVASIGVDNIRALPAAAAPFTTEDVVTALRIAGGLAAATEQELARLNLEETAENRIDLNDVARIARKVANLDPNP